MIDRTDKYHVAAQMFGTRWLTEANQFVLLDWVFVESMTLLKRHLDAALAVLKECEEGTAQQICYE